MLDVVRRRHHQELPLVAIRLERRQQLVDRAASLLVGVVVPALRDRIELVEEQEAGQVLDRRLKGLVDVLRRLALDPADQVAGRHVHQVHAVLPGDRAREEGLADTGRPVKQDAVPFDPIALGVVRVLEHEADGVADLLLERLHPADVRKVIEFLGRLDLEVAASAAHPAAKQALQRVRHLRRRSRARPSRLATLRRRLAVVRVAGPGRLRRGLEPLLLESARVLGHVDPAPGRLVVGHRPRPRAGAAHELSEKTAEGQALERIAAERLVGAALTAKHLLPAHLLLLEAAPAPGRACRHRRDDEQHEDQEQQESHGRVLPRATREYSEPCSAPSSYRST